MKKNFLLLILLFVSISCIVFYSCRRDNNVQSGQQQSTKAVSLQEAKMIYSYAGKEIETRFSDTNSVVSPQWANIKLEQLGLEHNAMYVPLRYDEHSGNYLQMLVMKDEGRLRSLLIEIKPDADWLQTNSSLKQYGKFTGKLLFYSANGRFYQGYVMKDGAMVKQYIPGAELNGISGITRINNVSSTLSTQDPCVWGTFGCQELADVQVVAKAANQNTYVYIYIPASVYNSNPNGGTYNGYTWYSSGGGGNGNPNPPTPPCDPDLAMSETQKLNNYAVWNPDESSVNMNTTTNYGEIIIGTKEVILGTGGLTNSWSIRASVEMKYEHTRYILTNTLTYQDVFNILAYKASDGYYVGSNTAITTIYTTVAPTSSYIISNNSPDAYALTHWVGKLNHEGNIGIPFCNLKPKKDGSLDVTKPIRPK